MLKVFKYITFGLILFATFCGLSIILWDISTEVIYFIGVHITNSIDYPGCGQWCNIEWDRDLQITVYTIYIAIYLMIIYAGITAIKRNKHNKHTNRIVLAMFVMASPSIGHVYLNCADDYHLVQCHKFMTLIVPVAMSINPISIAVFGYLAYRVFLLYYSRMGIKL